MAPFPRDEIDQMSDVIGRMVAVNEAALTVQRARAESTPPVRSPEDRIEQARLALAPYLAMEHLDVYHGRIVRDDRDSVTEAREWVMRSPEDTLPPGPLTRLYAGRADGEKGYVTGDVYLDRNATLWDVRFVPFTGLGSVRMRARQVVAMLRGDGLPGPMRGSLRDGGRWVLSPYVQDARAERVANGLELLRESVQARVTIVDHEVRRGHPDPGFFSFFFELTDGVVFPRFPKQVYVERVLAALVAESASSEARAVGEAIRRFGGLYAAEQKGSTVPSDLYELRGDLYTALDATDPDARNLGPLTAWVLTVERRRPNRNILRVLPPRPDAGRSPEAVQPTAPRLETRSGLPLLSNTNPNPPYDKPLPAPPARRPSRYPSP